MRSWIRRSPLVQLIYYGLHLDEVEQILTKSLDKEIDAALPVFLTEDELKDYSIELSHEQMKITETKHNNKLNKTFFIFTS